MKQLTCEMCGGTDLVKDSGVFVCQSCGTKYSVEEAKKMMIEGTVEVQGNVNVQNAAQLENLLNLAHSSFDAKNYAQAENFCNQVIAMDDKNYDAWKLKGEAINGQISTDNERILEVYNCLLKSYDILDDDGKDEHREEILKSLQFCLVGEIDFWLEQFEKMRPSISMLNKVTDTFMNCKSKIKTAYEKLGYSKKEAAEYEEQVKTHFVINANKRCKSAWNTTVYYNYNRGGFKTDKYYNGADEYRPDVQILSQYIDETDNLIRLLFLAEECFTNDISYETKKDIYNNIIFYNQKLIAGVSYKVQYNEAVQEMRWYVNRTLDDSAKASRNKLIAQYKQKITDLDIAESKVSPEKKEQLIKEYTNKINSIDTTAKPRISKVGMIISVVCLVVAIEVFICCVDVIKYLIPAIALIGAIIGIVYTWKGLASTESFVLRKMDEKNKLQKELSEITGTEEGYRKQSESREKEKNDFKEAAKKIQQKSKKVIIAIVSVCVVLAILFPTVIVPNVQAMMLKSDFSSAKVGDTITFGKYCQQRYVGEEDLDWTVLAIEDGKALITTKYLIDRCEYNEDESNTDWEDSSIRESLNDYFYDYSFTAAEKVLINKTKTSDSTSDKVFILSAEEVKQYIPSKHKRICEATEMVSDSLSDDIGRWWLRTTEGSKKVDLVTEKGEIWIADRGSDADYYEYVRPAMWIDIG